MKKALIIALLIPFIFACNTAEMENEITKLSEKNQRLIDETTRKDSVIITIVQSLNDIEENLDVIKQKENYIELNTQDATEFSKDRKTRIIEDIQLINTLMQENRQKIARLSRKLKKSGIQIVELEKMIARLNKTIEEKDVQISELKNELVNLNISLDSLSVAFQEKAVELEEKSELVEQQTQQLNTAYYCYGTFKELKEHGVVTKEGGFIGIGRIEKLTEDFNRKYFTEIDITETTAIDLYTKKAKIVTTHPSGSYEIEGTDKADRLLITNPDEFWNASKYLVIVVE